MPAMMNRMPSAMWPTRDQPPFVLGEDAESGVDEAGGDRVDRDDHGDDAWRVWPGQTRIKMPAMTARTPPMPSAVRMPLTADFSAEDSVDMRCPF